MKKLLIESVTEVVVFFEDTGIDPEDIEWVQETLNTGFTNLITAGLFPEESDKIAIKEEEGSDYGILTEILDIRYNFRTSRSIESIYLTVSVLDIY